MENLGKAIDVEVCTGYTAAGTAAINGSSVDMQGYEGVIFLAGYVVSAADNGLHVETSSNDSDFNDLEDSQNFLDATETLCVVEIHKPRERFLRPVVDRATSSAIEMVLAIKYGAHKRPVDLDALTDVAYELLVSPAEGTK